MSERKISELTEVTTLSENDELVFVKYEDGNPGPEPTTPTPTSAIRPTIQSLTIRDHKKNDGTLSEMNGNYVLRDPSYINTGSITLNPIMMSTPDGQRGEGYWYQHEDNDARFIGFTGSESGGLYVGQWMLYDFNLNIQEMHMNHGNRVGFQVKPQDNTNTFWTSCSCCPDCDVEADVYTRYQNPLAGDWICYPETLMGDKPYPYDQTSMMNITETSELIDALEFRWFSDDDLQEEPVLQVRNYEKPTHDNFKEMDTKSEWRTLYFFDGSEDVYDLEHSVWPDAGVKEEYPHEKEKTLDGSKITLRKNNNKNYLQIYVDGRAAFLFKNDNERKSMSIHRRVPGWPIIPKPGIEYAITLDGLEIDDEKTNTDEDNVTLSVSLIEGPDQWSYKLDKNEIVQVPQGTETTFSVEPGIHRVIVTPVNVINGTPRQVGTPKELKFEVDDIVTIPEPPIDDCIVPLDLCIVEEQLEQPMGLFEITGTNRDEKLDTNNDSVKVSLAEGCKIYLDTSKFTETPQQWPSEQAPNNDMQKTTSEFPVMVEFMDFRNSWRNFFGILYCAKVPTEPVDIYFEKNNVLYSANFIMPEWRGEAPSTSGNEVHAQHSIVRDWWSSRPKPFNPATYWKVRVYGHKKGNTNVVGVSGTWKLNDEDGCYYNYDLSSGEVYSDSSAKDNDYKFKLMPLQEDFMDGIQIWDENEESDNDPFVLVSTYILGSDDEVTSTQKADDMGTEVHFAVDWDGYGKSDLDENGVEIWPPRFCWKQGQKLFARIGYSDFSNNENSYKVRVHPQPCEDVSGIMYSIVIDEIIVDKTATENNVLVKVTLVENPDHWHYVLDDEPVKMVMQGEEVTLTVEPGHHKIEVWPTNNTHDKVGHSRVHRFYVPGYVVYDESYYEQQ